jgi:hypothetical protein
MAHNELAKILAKLQPLQEEKKRKMDDVLQLLKNRTEPLVADPYRFSVKPPPPPRVTFSEKLLKDVISQWNVQNPEEAVPDEFIDFLKKARKPRKTKEKKRGVPRLKISQLRR